MAEEHQLTIHWKFSSEENISALKTLITIITAIHLLQGFQLTQFYEGHPPHYLLSNNYEILNTIQSSCCDGIPRHSPRASRFGRVRLVFRQHACLHKGCRQKKKNSIFTDIIQIEVDPPPSHPIFAKFIFDTVLIMLTSLPPLEFLTKIMKF